MTVVPSDETIGPAIGRSPDDKHVFVLLESKKLETGEAQTVLRVYEQRALEQYLSGGSREAPAPMAEGFLASSTNTAAIRMARWTSDGRSIVFLGTRGQAHPQVFSFDIRDSSFHQLTRHLLGVFAFDIGKDKTIVFLGRTRVHDPTPGNSYGYKIDTASISKLTSRNAYYDSYATYVQRVGSSPVQIGGHVSNLVAERVRYWIAPDSKRAVMYGPAIEVLSSWKAYAPANTSRVADFPPKRRPAERREWEQYSLVNIEPAEMRSLLAAPAGTAVSNFVAPWVSWSEDSRHVVVANTMAPLSGSPKLDQERRLKAYVLEIDSESGAWATVGVVPAPSGQHTDPFGFVSRIWQSDAQRSIYLCQLAPSGSSRLTIFSYKRGEWHSAVKQRGAAGCEEQPLPRAEIVVHEGPNLPPVLVVRAKGFEDKVLFNLNPHFSSIAIAKVQNFEWQDQDGRLWHGGLMLARPQDGKPRPLVVQIYDFDAKRFLPNGTLGPAFAAQALAGAGMSVLQMSFRDSQALDTASEGPRIAAAIDAAVRELSKRALVNPTKIGLVGWSRGGYGVAYTLTHPRSVRIAAAVISDSFDGSYVQYVLNGDETWSGYENVNEGAPYGAGLASWLRNAPGFNLDKLQTPLRLEAIGGLPAVLAEWEIYSGLKRLGKVVELHSIPNGIHVLRKPLEEYYSRQGTVSWMSYWLLGGEGENPCSTPQNTEWKTIRSQDGLPEPAQLAADITPNRISGCISTLNISPLH